MTETPKHETLETPPTPEESIREQARQIGEEAKMRVEAALAGLEFRSGSMDYWPLDEARRAEAKFLHEHGLISDEELERKLNPEPQGCGRGFSITM